MQKSHGRVLLTSLLTLILYSSVFASGKPPKVAIASAAPQATRAGLAILQQGGNAFDAAVVVAAVLAVVEPYNSGVGGGGFWLFYQADKQKSVVIDSRETAPQKINSSYFFNRRGKILPQLLRQGPLSAAIPGEPAAFDYVTQHYGKLTLQQNLKAAIQLAQQGFKVDGHYRYLTKQRLEALQASPQASQIFLQYNEVPDAGFKVTQPELAKVLQSLAQQGRAGFYQGPVAQLLIDGVKQAGGVWQLTDLTNYQIVEREPLTGEYLGTMITTVPPPSSGGMVILTMLDMLTYFDLNQLTSTQHTQLLIEVMRRAYWVRGRFLGDPDFTQIAVKALLSSDYTKELVNSITLGTATPSESLYQGKIFIKQGRETTHFSILDKQGNRAAVTLSLNYPFGSGFVPPQTGVLLNNHIADFALALPKRSRKQKRLPLHPNALASGKRPLSSMTPTFLETEDRLAILGTPGGMRIPTMVFLAALDFVAGNTADSWVSVPRFHHQFIPDEVEFEKGAFDAELQRQLTSMGYHLREVGRYYGNMQAILWDRQNNKVVAASDPRRSGEGLVGYQSMSLDQ